MYRRCLQHQDIRTVFKSDTTLRSHLVRPKDALEPSKQDGVVCKIPCECGKVYIDETGRSMRERIKNKTETYGLLVLRPLRFRSTLKKRGIFLFGAKLSLLIVAPTGTHVESKRLSIIPTTSIGIAESKFPKLGYDTRDQTTQKPIYGDL